MGSVIAPNARRFRGRVLRRLHESATVQSVTQRVLDLSPHHVVPKDVAAGNVLNGRLTNRLPVVLIVMLGADDPVVRHATDEVAQLQRETTGFRPVFVLDVPALAAVRRYRYAAEMLVSEEAWDVADQGGVPWRDYAAQRIELMRVAYGATASLTLGAGGLDPAGRLMLSSLRPMAA